MDTLSSTVSSLTIPNLRKHSLDLKSLKNPYKSSLSHFNFSNNHNLLHHTLTPQTLTTSKNKTSSHSHTKNFIPSTTTKNPPLKHPFTHSRASTGYAAALLDAARCSNSFMALEKDVRRLKKWLRNAQLRAVMDDDLVDDEEKGSVVVEVVEKGKFDKSLIGLVKLLVKKKRVGIVSDVLMEFERMYDELCGTQVVLVSSDMKMDRVNVFGIAKKVFELSGAENVKVKVRNLVGDKKRSHSFCL